MNYIFHFAAPNFFSPCCFFSLPKEIARNACGTSRVSINPEHKVMLSVVGVDYNHTTVPFMWVFMKDSYSNMIVISKVHRFSWHVLGMYYVACCARYTTHMDAYILVYVHCECHLQGPSW